MERRKRKDQFPNGINTTIFNFNKALAHVMSSEEIENITKHASISEKRKIRKFREAYKTAQSVWEDMETYPIWPILMCLDSAEILKETVTYMIMNDKTVHRFED